MTAVTPVSERIWPPADVVKRSQLLDLFHRRNHRVFVESGTYLAGTVEYFLPFASRIVSVEIDPALHHRAVERMARFPHVELLLGDATHWIPGIVSAAESPPLVWLDGHYSGDITGRGDETEPAPTIVRLLADVAPSGTTIVIDDIRLFGFDPEWASLEALVDGAREAFPNARIYTSVDALVIEA